jgi:lipoyl(octanoyl) transferase
MRFISLKGLIHYEEARLLQHRLVELRARDLIEDTVLFLEHAPVITRGRGLQFTEKVRQRHMPLSRTFPPEILYCETERGGDLTYHGPGQLVIYPLCKLDGKGFGPKQDVGAFIRKCEQGVIHVLKDFGINAVTRQGSSGVWVGDFQDRKVASIGIAVRKWVTYHGIALNVDNDLKPFSFISPCGFSSEIMVNLKELYLKELKLKNNLFSNPLGWRKKIEKKISETMLEFT